jgi:hypothetical protein
MPPGGSPPTGYGTGGALNTSRSYAQSVTPSASGTLTSISVYLGASAGSPKKINVAIYTDNAGNPGALLASGTAQVSVANAWNTVPISHSFTAGVTYWLAVRNDTNMSSPVLYYLASGPAAAYSTCIVSGPAFDSTWQVTGTATGGMAIYGTYTASASVKTPVGILGSGQYFGA